jgi:hypothetical protein
MNLDLLRSPGPKPFLDISVNQITVTGGPEFGSNDNLATVTGTDALPFFNGPVPSDPTFAAGFLKDGMVFGGEFEGVIKSAGPQNFSIRLNLGDQLVSQSVFLVDTAGVFRAVTYKYIIHFYVRNDQLLCRLHMLAFVGTTSVTVLQAVSEAIVDPSQELPISWTALWDTAAATSESITQAGHMKKLIG